MAMSKRAEAQIKSLAARGDSFARHVTKTASARDVGLLAHLAKQRDVMALRHRDGAAAPVMVVAQMNSWEKAGDGIAAGINALAIAGDKEAQVITFAQPDPVELIDLGDPDGVQPETGTLVATGGASGLPVVFTLVSGPATLAGNELTITGAGSVVVRASQAGNDNYTAATPVQRTIVVTIAA